jgi:hypothetical protein
MSNIHVDANLRLSCVETAEALRDLVTAMAMPHGETRHVRITAAVNTLEATVERIKTKVLAP